MSMVKEVASRARELIEIENQRRESVGAPQFYNEKLSPSVRAAIDLAYELYREEDDAEELNLVDYIRVRNLALNVA